MKKIMSGIDQTENMEEKMIYRTPEIKKFNRVERPSRGKSDDLKSNNEKKK